MSEMCINSIFQHFFPILLAKKKLPRLLLFLHGLFVYAFSIRRTNFIKKNYPHHTFWLCAKKCQSGGRLVSWLVSLYVRLSVGLLLVISVCFFYIIFIGNLDY
jgi:hypothetical protein